MGAARQGQVCVTGRRADHHDRASNRQVGQACAPGQTHPSGRAATNTRRILDHMPDGIAHGKGRPCRQSSEFYPPPAHR
jgi:hypothetical protein